jgi:hypothetical protein
MIPMTNWGCGDVALLLIVVPDKKDLALIGDIFVKTCPKLYQNWNTVNQHPPLVQHEG